MKTWLLKLTTASLGFMVLLSESTFAQISVESGVHGSGSVVLERPAERMRMQIDLLAKSKNLADAITKLKSQKAKVEKQLDSLGATKESIKFGEVRLDESQDDEQRQMQMMMRQRMSQRRGKRHAEKESQGKPVKLTLRLTAEWSLKSKDAIGLLLETQKLHEAIKAADLAGLKESQEPTAEEAEVAEESEEMDMVYNSRQGPKQGEPVFLYFATIPAADREKALAEAFAAAKSEATRLAKAAEMELGPLRSLQSGASANDFSDEDSVQQLYNSGMGNLFRHELSNRHRGHDAIGPTPGLLKFHTDVTVLFAIK